MKKVPKKCDKLSMPETAWQRPPALAACLKRYTREAEAWRGNSVLHRTIKSVSQGNTMKADSPRLETEQSWKSMWEEEASHTDARWLEDFRTDLGTLPEEDPVTFAEADVLE